MTNESNEQRGNGISQLGSTRRIQDVNSGNQLDKGSLSTPQPSPHPSSTSESMRRAARELIHTVADRRSKRSVYDPRGYVPVGTSVSTLAIRDDSNVSGVGDFSAVDEERVSIIELHQANTAVDSPTFRVENMEKINYGSIQNNSEKIKSTEQNVSPTSRPSMTVVVTQQISAVIVIVLLNLMMAIPFGASYFPVGWKALAEEDGTNDDGDGDGDGDEESDGIQGAFPLSGKQNIGLRMFLLSTMIGQLVYTYKSKFINAVACQMVENVPFMHALAKTVIQHQGYGKEALSTLFFLFGLSSVLVGLIFYILGKLKQGKIVYFFPNHVLVGCIGGIGFFIVFTAIEVTTNTTFDIKNPRVAIQNTIVDRWYLLWVILAFEVSLRYLLHCTRDPITGRPKFQLLSPIFYILITPIFYIGMYFVFGFSLEEGRKMGYFFPSSNIGTSDTDNYIGYFNDPHLWDIFTLIDFSTISWTAVVESTGTLIALATFSLIHVPINIPAFAVSTDVDIDMNAELMAHGWSNGLSGMFGGLQNYMTYSNSVLYAKTGGAGRLSSLGICASTAVLFVIGPSITDYLPRCMAGTLLLHVGIDLVLEGVYDSIGQYDNFEYAGIWLITVVMTLWGMTAALIAGIISALSTYAAQSINYHNPIRQVLTATSLRSSAWIRCTNARSILENGKTGRSRILIFQLQGHIFFGNVALLNDTINDILQEKVGERNLPIVVIVDFTLVNGMDSSAAHAVAKLKSRIHRLFKVELSIFCTGSDRGGFPCEFALSEALSSTTKTKCSKNKGRGAEMDISDINISNIRGSVSVSSDTASKRASEILASRMDGRVCETLDDALQFAEDMLICRQDDGHDFESLSYALHDSRVDMTPNEESYRAKVYLQNMFSHGSSKEFQELSASMIVSMMTREEYRKSDIVWDHGAHSSSLKIVVSGELLSLVDETGASEIVKTGSIVGELGLVHGISRLTTLACLTPTAILYSLDVGSWQKLKDDHPKTASLIDGIVITYLAHRVQHVSNRYFHTTLPV